MKRCYLYLPHFHAQAEAGNIELPLIVVDPETGEEIYLDDLMVGIDSLPPRQREAFEMIVLQGWTETDATKVMLPDSKWSTPIQQYSDTALERMVAAYDAKQAGTWVHTVYTDKRKSKAEPDGEYKDGRDKNRAGQDESD